MPKPCSQDLPAVLKAVEAASEGYMKRIGLIIVLTIKERLERTFTWTNR
jgi:hypothetical protein